MGVTWPFVNYGVFTAYLTNEHVPRNFVVLHSKTVHQTIIVNVIIFLKFWGAYSVQRNAL